MTRTSRLKKQHKPIGFGDAYDRRFVEGHRNAVSEARETREYNKRMKEIEAERKANKPLTEKLADWLRSKFRRLDRQL
jgi:hypothetical protein